MILTASYIRIAVPDRHKDALLKFRLHQLTKEFETTDWEDYAEKVYSYWRVDENHILHDTSEDQILNPYELTVDGKVTLPYGLMAASAYWTDDEKRLLDEGTYTVDQIVKAVRHCGIF